MDSMLLGFLRHRAIYQTMSYIKLQAGDGVSPRPPHRIGELPPVYPWAGCSPAEPASVSTDDVNVINNRFIINILRLK